MAPMIAERPYRRATAPANRSAGTARNRPRNEPGRVRAGSHVANTWWVTAPSSATATTPWTIRSTVVMTVPSLEQFHGREWLGRSGPKPVEGKLRLLSRLDVDQDVVVILLPSLPLPVQLGRIVRRHLHPRATGQDRVLLGPATAQHQVLDAVDLVDLGGVDVRVEHHHLHVLGVGGDQLVRIVGGGNGAKAGAGEDRVVKDDERLASPRGLGLVQPLLHLLHLVRILRPITVP